MKSQLRWILPLLTIGALAAGCSPRNEIKLPEIPNPLAKRDKKPKLTRPVREIVCVWKHAEGNNGKGSPTRGVAGQIMFFTHGQETPIKIDDESEVVIYMFDDQGTPEEQSKPIAKFRFVDNAWNKHLGNGQLGPTYQVFLPYNRNVVHQVKVTLSVRLLPRNREPLSSSPDTITLFGPVKDQSKATLARSIERGENREKTSVSSFGPHAKENAFAKLAKKIHTTTPPPANPAAASRTADAQAEALLRRHGLTRNTTPATSGVRQATGYRAFQPSTTGRTSEPARKPFPQPGLPGYAAPAASASTPRSLPGTGIQLTPAAGASSLRADRETAPSRRAPAVHSRHPLDDSDSARPEPRPSRTAPAPPRRQEHPLKSGNAPFSSPSRGFNPATTHRHPLSATSSPSRQFFPKSAAWDTGDEYDAPANPAPRSLDERRREIQKSFEEQRYRHPLGHEDHRGAAGTAHSRHPLADDFGSRRSFR